VVEALETVAKWVAKLPPLAIPAPRAASISPVPGPVLASPTPEVEVIPRRRGPKQGTKRGRRQMEVEDQVQAQILGEIEAIQLVEPVLGRGKRVRISKKQ
jgi:hypothetical protein